ncbi:Acetyltransferase (GNAT) domain protein [uncultured archaeon]|nr:Acetyltransferase (GNAT) domain protein [uncultured archaeon]
MPRLLHLTQDNDELFMEATDLFQETFRNSQTVQEMYVDSRPFIERTIVALHGTKVVGALKRGYNPDLDAISVDFLAVNKDHRRAGVGHLLLSELEKFAKERDNKKTCLFPRTNPEVVNFYQKRGYVFIPDYKPRWMEKVLN